MKWRTWLGAFNHEIGIDVYLGREEVGGQEYFETVGVQRILKPSVCTAWLEPQTFTKLIKSIICCSEKKMLLRNVGFFLVGF